MKKFFALLLVACMMLSVLAACGKEEKETKAPTQAPTTAPTDAPATPTEPEAPTSAVAPTEPAAPSATEPAAPSATEPAAPSATVPAAPSATVPAAPSATEPAAPSATETAAPTDPIDIPENAVLFYTPEVDGLLDDAYLESFHFTSAKSVDGATDADYTSENEAYVLWDGQYIYVAVIVYDDDLITRGLEYINGTNKGGDNNPWANDSIDLFYTFEGTAPTAKAEVRKLCLDRMGIGLVKTAPGEGLASNWFSDAVGKATYILDYDTTAACKDRSILEFKIPAKSENAGDGEYLQVEELVYFAIQVNDIATGAGEPDPDYNPGTTWTKAAQRMWYNEETGTCGYAEGLLTNFTPKATGTSDKGEETIKRSELDDNAVLFHTPVVDGILDVEYLKSLRFSSAKSVDGATDDQYTSENEAYVLWDGEYIYVAVIVYDDDLVTRGLEYINGTNKSGDNNPWANDSIDLFYTFEGTAPTAKADTRKICLDRMGVGAVKTAPGEGLASNWFSDVSGACKYTLDYDTTATCKDRSVLEFKIPAKSENAGDGEYLQVEELVYFAIQVNDIATPGEGDAISDPDANPGTTWTKAAQRMWYNEETGTCGYAECQLTQWKPNQVIED